MNGHPSTPVAQVSDGDSLPATTVWSFPTRGRWATHRGDYRGNWAPQVPRNVIRRYSQPGDVVVDAMCGSGTTLIECALLGRRGLGFDVNERAVSLSLSRIEPLGGATAVARADARALPLPDACAALYLTHPPYHDIIAYSENTPGDLSRAPTVSAFLRDFRAVAREARRVVRPRGRIAFLVGDRRRGGEYVPLAYLCLREAMKTGMRLKEYIIKIQWNCQGDRSWRSRGTLPFHLIAHEHLFVLERD